MTEPSGRGRAAVFLDRDGTVIPEFDFLDDPARLVLLPGVAAAVRRLNEAGFAAVVVTNQSGVARGLFDEATLEAVNARLREELAREGALLDLVLCSPYHPDFPGPSSWDPTWRKPQPGMLLAARARLGLDLAKSWMVGDSIRDLEAGRRAGLLGLVLVRTGKGAASERELEPPLRASARVTDDLPAAVECILKEGT